MDNEQHEIHELSDLIYLYTSLFYKVAAKNHYTREDFQSLIAETYDNLPIRGNAGEFWENILKTYNIPLTHQSGENNEPLDNQTLKALADAIWLPYDQEISKSK